MLNTKKELQKVIKAIRGESLFPKAMMTEQQMRKGQATINCGGEYLSEEVTMETVYQVLDAPIFKEFLNKHSATAEIERGGRKQAQIRIHF